MSERVIWERNVDHDAIARRRLRFRNGFLVPAALLLLVVLVIGGIANAVGVLIVLAIAGGIWGTSVRFASLSDAANPTLIVRGGKLRLGDRAVPLREVRRFTTLVTSVQTSLLGRRTRLHIGKAIFRLDDGGTRKEPELVEFGWPNMKESGVASIREALEAQLPGKWVEPHELVEESELPRRKRRRDN